MWLTSAVHFEDNSQAILLGNSKKVPLSETVREKFFWSWAWRWCTCEFEWKQNKAWGCKTIFSHPSIPNRELKWWTAEDNSRWLGPLWHQDYSQVRNKEVIHVIKSRDLSRPLLLESVYIYDFVLSGVLGAFDWSWQPWNQESEVVLFCFLLDEMSTEDCPLNLWLPCPLLSWLLYRIFASFDEKTFPAERSFPGAALFTQLEKWNVSCFVQKKMFCWLHVDATCNSSSIKPGKTFQWKIWQQHAKGRARKLVLIGQSGSCLCNFTTHDITLVNKSSISSFLSCIIVSPIRQ